MNLSCFVSVYGLAKISPAENCLILTATIKFIKAFCSLITFHPPPPLTLIRRILAFFYFLFYFLFVCLVLLLLVSLSVNVVNFLGKCGQWIILNTTPLPILYIFNAFPRRKSLREEEKNLLFICLTREYQLTTCCLFV